MKAAGEFLGDEAGGQRSRLPTRMLHQGGKKRDIVADALDGEGVERIGLRRDRLLAGRRMGHQLGDHRIVIERDFAAFGDAGIVAHGDAARAPPAAGGSA